MARPQEVRAFQWKHLMLEPVPMFRMTEYKAKNRRKRENKRHDRKILLDSFVVKMLARLMQRRAVQPDEFVPV